ncbi:MAG: AEC family transporter [Bacillota bacterium]
MGKVNQIFIISLAVILLGYFLKKLKILNKNDGNSMVKIIMNITLPALIITVFIDLDLNANLIILPLTNIIYGVLAYFLGKRLFADNKIEDAGSLIISLLGFNIGLFAYPFIENIWGKTGLQYMAFFDMGNAVIIFGLAYITAASYGPCRNELSTKVIAKKLLTFIPLMSYLLALLLNIFNIELNFYLFSVLKKVAGINGVLVLLVLGIYLEFKLERSELKKISKAVIIKYSFGLIVGLILYLILPFGKLFNGVILLGLVMPTGMAVIPYSIENKLNTRISGSLVNLTNILSFVFMWLIFKFI